MRSSACGSKTEEHKLRNVRAQEDVQRTLEAELNRLVRVTGLGHSLKVRWTPNPNSDRDGEVIGNVIYIYAERKEKAIKTLKHEFLDYHLMKEIIEPLVHYINLQKSLIESLVYRRKEKFIDLYPNSCKGLPASIHISI